MNIQHPISEIPESSEAILMQRRNGEYVVIGLTATINGTTTVFPHEEYDTYDWDEYLRNPDHDHKFVSWRYLDEKIKIEFRGLVGYRRAKRGEYRFIVNPVNHAEWDKDKTKCTFARIGYKWLLYLGGFLVGHGFQQQQDEAIGCMLTYYNINIANRPEVEEKP